MLIPDCIECYVYFSILITGLGVCSIGFTMSEGTRILNWLNFYAGSKDHIKVQGEILEGLVGRIVSHESSKYMEQVLKDSPPYQLEGGKLILFLH